MLKKTTYIFLISVLISNLSFSQGAESSLDFDGTNDYIDLGVTGIPLGTNFTLEAWVYSSQVNALFHGIMGNQSSGSTNRAPGLWIYQNTRIHYGFGNGTTWQSSLTPIGTIIENQWNHIALTYQGSELKVYANGILVGTKTGVTGTPINPFRWIGRVDNYFRGEIDEVRVWSVTRSETDIRTYMCQKLVGTEAGLEGYWRFDDGSGSTLTDITAASIDGTLTNMNPASDWVTSGAAIGDASSFSYPVTFSGEVVTLSSVDRGNLEVNTVSGSPDGVHIYRVDQTPNSVTGITNTIGANDIYYGVYVVGGSSPSYTVKYDYTSYVAAQVSEPNIEGYNREDNTDGTWASLSATIDLSANTFTETGITGLNQEFLIGGLDSTDLLGYLGPGGVGHTDGNSGLVAWYYPKNIRNSSNVLPTDGETIDTWIDASGYGNTATNTGTATYESDGASQINENSVMDASALNRQFVTSNSITGKTLIAVNNPESRNSFEAVIGFNGDKGIRRPSGTDNTWQYAGGGDGVNNDTWSTNTGNSYVNGSTSNEGVHSNTLHIISQERPTTYSNDFYLGGYYPSRSFTGILTEAIVYDTDLNLAQKIIVDNYLAAKYGISLVTNDFFNEDEIGAGDFDFDVAGIGQATDGSSHTDSQGTGIVRINNPNALGNDEYLFWGRNNQDDLSFATNTSNYKERLNTVWRASRRNNPGRVTVTFDLTGVDLSGKQSCADLQLIIDNNSDLLSPSDTYTLTNIGGSFYRAENVRIRNNRYFTIEYQDLIVVDGTQFYNGSGASNVPDTTDDCYKFLVKNTADGTLALTENADVREVEIESGGNLVVNTDIRLQVTNGIANSGDLRLIGTSQLLQTHTGTSLNSGTGNLFVDQKSEITSVYRYNYWSSPVVTSGTTTYTVEGEMKDGTTVTSVTSNPPDLSFTTGYTGSSGPLTLSSYWIFGYIDGTTGADWVQKGENGTFNAGEGYLLKSPGIAQNYTFKGTPNDGEITSTLSGNTTSLLGNPYPSALDANEFFVDNAGVVSTLYFWEHKNELVGTGDEGHYQSGYIGGYGTRNASMGLAATTPVAGTAGLGGETYTAPGQYIPIGQGFFAQSTVAGGTVEFNNGQRSFVTLAGDSHFFKGKKKKEVSVQKELSTIPLLKLGFEYKNLEEQNLHKQIGATFLKGNTFALENGFDSEVFELTETDVYFEFENGDEKLIIAGLPEITDGMEVPISLKIGNTEPVYLMIDDLQHINQKIYLKDAVTNQKYELNIENVIPLNLDIGTYSDRFSLIFEEGVILNTKEDVLTNDLFIFIDDISKELVVKNKNQVYLESIKLYTIYGKEIENWKNQENSEKKTRVNISGLKSAVYIVNIQTEKGTYSEKIIIIN